MPKLLANRSAAALRAGRLEAALQDAQRAVELNPLYDKAYWRIAAAYQALKQPVHAAETLATFCRQSPAEAGPLAAALTRTIAQLNTHQLAAGIMKILNQLPINTSHQPADLQRVIAAQQHDNDSTPTTMCYKTAYQQWLLHGVPHAEALVVVAQLDMAAGSPHDAAHTAITALHAAHCTVPDALCNAVGFTAQHMPSADQPTPSAWVVLEAFAVLADALDALQAPPAARAAARVLAANAPAPPTHRLRMVCITAGRLRCIIYFQTGSVGTGCRPHRS